jgi:predicted dehydrogenase
MDAPLRLAILGCGAIARIEHLPAALAHPAVRLTALIDADRDRAAVLKRQGGSDCEIYTDLEDVVGSADAVVNALPNHLHAPLTLKALKAGMHVLCEKPLAITSADGLACAEAAEERKLVLAIGMSRRFVGSNSLLHLILQQQVLGKLEGYDWQSGGALDWKSASGFYFDRALAGGGVLIDLGVHLLDSLIDWFGPIVGIDYEDDDWGSGIEANCFLRTEHSGPHGTVHGTVRLSRTFPLNNRLLVSGSQGGAEITNLDLDSVILHRELGDQPVTDTLRLQNYSANGAFYRQLDNFVESVRGRQQPLASARSGVAVLQCVEKCYANRRRIPEPWSEVPATAKVGA